jgi:uncharacterized protein (UPF0332 family)
MKMNYEFERCIEKGKLAKFEKGLGLAKRELEAAAFDLERAKADLSNDDFKWATIKGYYSMFHAAKAFVYSKCYREKTHYCLLVAFRELSKGIMKNSHVRNFEEAMRLREEADYALKFSRIGAEDVVENASEFIGAIKGVLKV